MFYKDEMAASEVQTSERAPLAVKNEYVTPVVCRLEINQTALSDGSNDDGGGDLS